MKTIFISSQVILVLAGVLSASLSAAPHSHKARPDAGLVAAYHSVSNTLEEGITTGTFDALYPGYGWAREVREIGSNRLFQAEYLIFDETQAAHSQHALHGTPLTILLFRPLSKPGGATRGFVPPWSQPAFHSSLPGQGRGSDSSAQSALLVVGEALVGVQYSVANLGHYLFLSDSESVTFTAQLPARFTGVGTGGAQEWRRVRIGLRPGLRGQTNLVIEHTPLFVHLAGGQTTFRHVVAENVRSFHLQYPQPTTGEVLDSWPYTNQIPRLIQATLELGRSHSPASSTDSASRIFPIRTVALAPWYQGTTSIGTNVPRLPPSASKADEPVDWTDSVGQIRPIANKLNPDALVSSMSARLGDTDQRVELEWLARSGVELAKYVLALESIGPIANADYLKQRWAGGPGEPGSLASQIPLEDLQLGSGRISVKIVDLERRFNLNVVDEMILRQAMTLIGTDPPQFQLLIDSILDWRDRDDVSRSAGAENDYYVGLNPTYVARNGPFDDLSELLWVKGMTSETYGHVTEAGVQGIGFKHLFTAASRGQININTVSSHVLQLMPEIDENIASAIIQGRAGPDGQDGTADDVPYRNPAEIAVRVPGFVNPGGIANLIRYFTVRSSVFEVTVDVECDGEKRQYLAWLARGNPKLIQILKLRQN